MKLPFKRSAHAAGMTAVCLLSERVDVATIEWRTGERPQIKALESYQRGANDLDALKRLGIKYRQLSGQCTTLLASGEYQLLQMEIPADGERPLRELIAEKLAAQLDQPLANFTYDAVRIPTEELAPGRPQNAYAVVAGNAVIAPKVQLFHRAKLGLATIDIPELAQRNVAALCETADRALAFLSFDQNDGLLTFTCNGELYMSRRVEVGLKQLLTDDLERRSSVFDRVGLEVQRSMDNFDRQYGFLPLMRLLLGPHPATQPLQGYLADYLAITVDVLDLREVLDTALIPELKEPARQAQCLLALGAALRREQTGQAMAQAA